jgi:Leucine-rich repeat (LRR) protein
MLLLLGFVFPVSAQIPSLQETYSIISIEEARIMHPDSVKAIAATRKKLKSIPSEIFAYPNLEYLDLRNNRIRFIPDSIRLLAKLMELNLSGNPIDSISPSIAGMKKLRYLRLGKTDLVVLPPEIGQLNNLEFLDIWGTFITWPPKEIALLSENLKLLDMRVIRMNLGQQERVVDLLPSTKILFSKNCNCNFP